MGDAGLRSFGSSWGQEMIKSINGYGCWCYFQDAHGQGRGQPANDVDHACKILHDGYTCILMDSEAEVVECTPWDVEYQSATGFGLDAATGANDSAEYAIRKSCNRANKKSKCSERACKVEGYFVLNLFKLFLQ